MTRRLLIAALFVGFALSSTGCCGVLRNFVYRVRHNHGCYPAFGGPCCDAGPVCSPSYSVPGYAAPVFDGGMPAPGCAGCGAANVPVVPPQALAYPAAPGYAYGPPTAPMPGTATPAPMPGAVAKYTGVK